jgi:hypothetical protein
MGSAARRLVIPNKVASGDLWMKSLNVTGISTFDAATGDLNVIIETPRGSRNKFDFDDEYKLFKLAKVLPEGMVFPFEFGFIPGTRGDDGDPSRHNHSNGRPDPRQVVC